jgi:hypothetical protein
VAAFFATYYRYTIQGSHSADVAQAMLGPAVSHGLIVRVDAKDNETHVIIAADRPAEPTQALPDGVKAAGTVAKAEVQRIP